MDRHGITVTFSQWKRMFVTSSQSLPPLLALTQWSML
jgi:hypothetical protein